MACQPSPRSSCSGGFFPSAAEHCNCVPLLAAGKPGTVAHVGLKTFVDPRLDGGKLNSVTTEDIVELVQLGGKEQLFYKSHPVHCCIPRGTYADEKGNISLEREGATPGSTSMAQAVKRAGGTDIIQVNRVVRAGTLHAQAVKAPHLYVDYVVEVPLEKHMPEVHPDMIDVHAGTWRIPSSSIPVMGMSERKIIGRRGAMQLAPGSAVNLGKACPRLLPLLPMKKA